jgi:glycosyltransferase involved in cell wall biosynthesis/GT2 family glycosyltransferase
MADPRVAVVIPIFKQPALAVEALESALRQETSFGYRVVAVNDGCPWEETDQVCRAYAAARPGRVAYVRRKNGGLSAARNTGIELALRAWPTVEAVQMLDSDDRLGPRALEIAYRALREHPEAAWVSPDIKRFGFGRDYHAMTGPWSLLELLAGNYVACGSMIRRAVLERGLRYDEQMKLGYEDWDFWLQCAAAGFRGMHVPEIEFCYRKRADSMLAGSQRVHEVITHYMRRKHAGQYTPRRAIELEQDEFPRYAILLADAGRVVLTSDPGRETASFPVEELAPRLLRCGADPQRARFPTRFVVTSEAFLRFLNENRLAAGLFWLAQARLEQTGAHVVALHFQARMQTDYCLQVLPGAGAGPPGCSASLALLTTQMLHECLLDPDGEWFRTIFSPKAEPRVKVLRLRYGQPRPIETVPQDALKRLCDWIDDTRPGYQRLPVLNVAKGQVRLRADGESCRQTQRLVQTRPLFPSVLGRAGFHVGFVTPICDFGGAERVTLNLAREARRYGWTPHLFIIGSAVVRLLGEFGGVFETISVVDRWELWKPETLAGLLGSMDVVINNNCWILNDVLAPLRRLGVKTYSHLHSITLGPHGVTIGQPFEALRHEHSLDGVVVISRKLHRWCRAQAVPEDKLIHVPNAPSFGASDALVETTLVERAERTAGQQLRVLFIGRFDVEKGLDRLAGLAREARQQSLPLEWRVVGRKVLGHGPAAADLAVVEPFLRPPALSTAALSRVYRWADVVVMLSRYEGVPLTILEAQRFGCVVLSTKVGAIDELIEHGRTGFLFANDLDIPTLVDEMLLTLRELHLDRTRLLAVAQASAALRRQATWSRSFASLAGAVEALVPRAADHRDENASRPAIRLENRRKGAEAA